MKKTIAFLLSVFAIIGSFCGCSKDVNNTVEDEEMYHAQCSVQECKDGWFFFIAYEYNLSESGEETDRYFNADAVNLKHNDLKDYQVLVVDEDTQEVTDTIAPEVSYFSMNPKYESLLSELKNHLLEREQKPNLTLDEIAFLKDNDVFSHDDIVQTYNSALTNGDLEFGKYGNISESGLKCEKALSGYMWQVGYYVSYGNILAVNIELITEDGTYLSDIAPKDRSAQQQQIIEEIDKIEKNIIKTQNFIALGIDRNTEIGHVKISRLFHLLEKIEKDNHNDKIE